MAKVTALVDDDGNATDNLELVPATPPNTSRAVQVQSKELHKELLAELQGHDGPAAKPMPEPVRSVVDIFWSHGERESRRVTGLKVEHGIATFQQGPVTHYINLAQTRSFSSEEAQDA